MVKLDPTFTQLIFDKRLIAYAITDRDLRVTQTGGAVDELFAFHVDATDAEQEPQTIFDLSPELIGYNEELQKLLDGTSPLHQLDLVNREMEDNAIRYVLLQSYPLVDGDKQNPGLLHVVEDVSELGNLRQHLMQERNNLLLVGQKLRDRNNALDAANSELKQLDKMKTRFVSTAAHELRTPLSTISGYVEILLEPDYEPLTDNQEKCLSIVERNTKRLIKITDDLLDVSGLEAGRIELLLRPTDFEVLIGMTIKDLQPLIDAKEQKLAVEIEDNLPKALCDEARTMQILTNLVSNAIKYSPDGGTITLHLGMAEMEGYLLFAVADDGIGIPEKDKPQLFDSLTRGSNVYQSGSPGVGLGLYIVKSLVELHGGQVWFESQENEGATFYVTFPLDDGLFD